MAAALPARAQITVPAPVARPAPEPMDPEFVTFDGLNTPPLQSEQVKLHRRFANVLAEVDRIEAMLNRLGITPDGQPDPGTARGVQSNICLLYICTGTAGAKSCI